MRKLKREEFGFLTLEKTYPGDYRELRSFEVQKVRKLALDENRFLLGVIQKKNGLILLWVRFVYLFIKWASFFV